MGKKKPAAAAATDAGQTEAQTHADPNVTLPPAGATASEPFKSDPPKYDPPKASAAKAAVPAVPKPAGELVTYVPQQEGDPHKTRWAGIVFHANVPVRVTNPRLVEKARENPWFHVGEGPPVPRTAPKRERPKTPDQYRAHVVAWLKEMDSPEELQARWIAEEGLRQECGVGPGDLDYLETLIRPKLTELKRAATVE